VIGLGLDPGLRRVGFCIIEWPARADARILRMGVIRPHLDNPLPQRLAEIAADVAVVTASQPVVCVGVEETYVNNNPRSSLALAHARAAVILGALRENPALPVFAFAPAAIKKAVAGRGTATKQQVAASLCAILGERCAGQRHDATDAAAVALCAILSQRSTRVDSGAGLSAQNASPTRRLSLASRRSAL